MVLQRSNLHKNVIFISLNTLLRIGSIKNASYWTWSRAGSELWIVVLHYPHGDIDANLIFETAQYAGLLTDDRLSLNRKRLAIRLNDVQVLWLRRHLFLYQSK